MRCLLYILGLLLTIHQSFGLKCYECVEDINNQPSNTWQPFTSSKTLCKKGTGGHGMEWEQTTECASSINRCSTTKVRYKYSGREFFILNHGCSYLEPNMCTNDWGSLSLGEEDIPIPRYLQITGKNGISEFKKCTCDTDFCNLGEPEKKGIGCEKEINCVQCSDEYMIDPNNTSPPPSCKQWEADGKPIQSAKYSITCSKDKACGTTAYKYNYEKDGNLITVYGTQRGCLQNGMDTSKCLDSTEKEEKGKNDVIRSMRNKCKTLKIFSAATCGCDGRQFCNINDEAEGRVCDIFKEMKKNAGVMLKSEASSVVIFLGIVMSLSSLFMDY